MHGTYPLMVRARRRGKFLDWNTMRLQLVCSNSSMSRTGSGPTASLAFGSNVTTLFSPWMLMLLR